MPAAYQFVDRWFVPFAVEAVYDVIGAPLEGGGKWTFEEVEGGTSAVLDWRPIVQKAGVKHLTPVLRPLFRSNHNWTMRRGEKHIAEYLAGRS